MPSKGTKERIRFIDTARFLAIALVFYGHFIERVMYLKNPTAASQYKFIYAFHMVLFFVLAGYVAKESDLSFGFGKFIKHRIFSRLLPFVFFMMVFMLAAALFPGDFFQLKLPSVQGYIDGLVNTVFGIPMFCVPSWFLLTYRLNIGLFSFPPLDAVVILFSSHGHFIWFPLTAIAGCLMVFFVARALPAWRLNVWMGQNTRILMCLNGILYHFINPPNAKPWRWKR